MLPVSALSDAANKLRSLLLAQIDDLDDAKRIKIGHPKDTFEEIEKVKDKNQLNLFFYNVGYDGTPADGSSEDPFYVRLHCLITAVGAKNGSPSAGENDLRLIGEVMRVLHQHPVISVDDLAQEEIAQLQVVPHPLNLDNLNHIWSTQGDTAYRLSVAYEMALAPVPLAKAVEKSPRIAEIGVRVEPDMDPEPLPANGFGIEISTTIIPKVTVNTRRSDWSPRICFVDETKECLTYTLLVPTSQLPAAGSLSLKVLVAGKPSDQIELVWESWNPSTGWQKADASQTETLDTDSIDPEAYDPTLAVDIDLPIQDKGQATLYAERAWQRPDGSTVTLRSNPLLVTVYEAGV